MKSVPIALTWEFWQRAWISLIATVACLFGLAALIYGGLQREGVIFPLDPSLASLHIPCFIFVAIGLSAAISHSSGSPQYRFSLPVSIRASILIPMINGAIATAAGYLSLALLVNWIFDAHWPLVEPTMTAVWMIAVCQSLGWMCGASSTLRGTIDAGLCTLLGVVVVYLNEPNHPDQFYQNWSTIRPLDLSLAIIVPIAAYAFSFVVLTLARRGQVFSMSTMGRWLLAKLDVSFGACTPGTTPLAAELWLEWTRRGRAVLAGPMLIAATLCEFFLSGRFEWESAWGAIVGLTWMQVMIGGAIMGLFVGHVGERFDFHEYAATRPLSDSQLADVKLRNALKSVCWSWIIWVAGLAVAIVCLALVGQGPTRWIAIVPPASPPLLPIIYVVMVPLCSWTLASLGVSIVILRPWLVKTVLCTLALLPFVPYGILCLMPELENEIFAASLWSWICLTIGGTVALYVTAFRLQLITAKRISIVGASYLLFFATCLSALSFLPPIEIPPPSIFGFLLSSCLLPFVCVAAVPLAIWWNRHR